jgi:hypothetical protein
MSKIIIMLVAVLALSVFAQDNKDTVQVQEPYSDTVMLLGSIDVQPAELPTVATAKARLAMADQLLEQLNSFDSEALHDYQVAYYDAAKGEWYKTMKSASSSTEGKTATAMLGN